jgi:hypothetical protein
MTEPSGTLSDSLSMVHTNTVAGGKPQAHCQIEAQAWARPYFKLVIIAFALNVISAALFIALVNRPVYDDKYNMRDVQLYAHNGLSVATALSHQNPPGPTSFLWMAGGVRLLRGGELRDARIANLISWVLFFVGILVGAYYGSFPQIWYGALLAALVFPHTVMSAATTLTEGPALLFAILGALIWIEAASRRTITASSFSLLILAGFSMGIAVSCRQYYLALLPAAALFGLFRLRGQGTQQKFLRLLGTVLSLSVASVPVILLIGVWRGITSPGAATGTGVSLPDWKVYADLNLFRPTVAAFYSCFYLVPLTFPAVWRVRPPARWLGLLVASIAGIVGACLGGSLLQPGPLRAFIWMGSRLPAGEFILVGGIAALTVYNAIAIALVLWEKRLSLLSCPPVIFALLTMVFFIVEQLGVGGNVPFYDRYLLQIAPFLGIIAFSLIPRLGFARLLSLAGMNLVGHVMLWSHVFDR